MNLNPDTETTVIERTSINEPANGQDTSPQQHGTLLAMLAAAPHNNWGTTGTAPTATRIISVRILEPGQTTFPFAYYTDGITTCLQRAREEDIKVINLSLGNNETPSSQDYEALRDAVQRATDYGVAVVAAAGNDDGGPLDYPAAYPGVLSVGASDTTTGALCSFSNRGEGLRLLAPGCDLDAADPVSGEEDYNYWQGSSEASVIGAAALAALEAYRPELTVQEAENDLTNADGGTLDIAQSFRDAGLSEIVNAGEAAEPHTTSTPSTPPQGMPTPTLASTVQTPRNAPTISLKRLTAPHVRLVLERHRLVLMLYGRPGGVRTQVRLLGHRGHTGRLAVRGTLTSSSSTITLAPGALEVQVRYIDPYDINRASSWTMLKAQANPPKPGRP